MHLNSSTAAAGGQAGGVASTAAANGAVKISELISDKDLFDDAESADEADFADILGGVTVGQGSGVSSCMPQSEPVTSSGRHHPAWEADNMCVRLLDWNDSLVALTSKHQQQLPQQQQEPTQLTPAADISLLQQHTQQKALQEGPSSIPDSQTFPVVLGNEVMYEPLHAQLVAAVLRHRLCPGGQALLCCAVRDQHVFDIFRDNCAKWGLRYRAMAVAPRAEDRGGIHGREHDYEGGFLLMAVDHVGARSSSWHRHDFVTISSK